MAKQIGAAEHSKAVRRVKQLGAALGSRAGRRVFSKAQLGREEGM